MYIVFIRYRVCGMWYVVYGIWYVDGGETDVDPIRGINVKRKISMHHGMIREMIMHRDSESDHLIDLPIRNVMVLNSKSRDAQAFVRTFGGLGLMPSGSCRCGQPPGERDVSAVPPRRRCEGLELA